MADYKLNITVGNPTVKKIWDKKQSKPAGDALKKALEKATKPLNKLSEKSALAKKVKSDAKEVELKLTPSIDDLTLDEKKKEIGSKVGAQLLLEGNQLVGSVSANAKIQGVNVDKIERDISDLMDALAGELAKSVKSQL